MKNKKYITTYGISQPPMKKVFRWKMGNLFKKRRAKNADDAFGLKVNFLKKRI